jgi:RNA polymerase sigma factor (TIGR02999 family)
MEEFDAEKRDQEAQEVTLLLSQLRAGDAGAAERLFPLVYAKLQGLARAVFSGQNPGHTLQPTALVHEAWLKLAGNLAPIDDRRHFFIVAGKAMRQVIADHARGRSRQKRGGERQRLTLDTDLATADQEGVDLVDLDDSLRALAKLNGRHAQVAELRIFGGLSIEETALALEISTRSVYSDWAMASAWLRRELASRG